MITPLLLIAMIDVDKLAYRGLKIESQSNNNCKPFWDDKDADEDKAAMLAGAQVADDQSKFVENMQNMFYTFVRTGVLPKGKDMSQGMYIVNKDIITQTPYPNCDFWKTTRSIVPTYANLD